ncbi:GntR family transcriptional regulator [Streptomyces sp. NPDC000927]|uniref:GntR family transcriptional regulator n=1 Tax=Streptomyces sp. NPDC000927 TaxID=3154371 RepID=UPI0033303F4C
MAKTSKEISDGLRERIRSGDLPPGARLPGEPTLMKTHGIAKETARRSLAILVNEGLAVRRRGSGTYVREFHPIRRVANRRLAPDRWRAGKSIWSADTTEHPVQVTGLRVHEAPAPDDVARALGLPEGSAVVIRERVYVVDGNPAQAAVSYLPADLVRDSPIAREDTGPGGTYARLAELGAEPDQFIEELRSRMPSQEEAQLLHLAGGTPVIEIFRTALTEDGRPVEVNRMVLDAGMYVLEYHVQG